MRGPETQSPGRRRDATWRLLQLSTPHHFWLQLGAAVSNKGRCRFSEEQSIPGLSSTVAVSCGLDGPHANGSRPLRRHCGHHVSDTVLTFANVCSPAAAKLTSRISMFAAACAGLLRSQIDGGHCRARYGATPCGGTQTFRGNRPACQKMSMGMPPRGYQYPPIRSQRGFSRSISVLPMLTVQSS